MKSHRPHVLFYTASFEGTGGDNQFWQELLLESPEFSHRFRASVVLRKNETNKKLALRLQEKGASVYFYDARLSAVTRPLTKKLVPWAHEGVIETLFVGHRFRWIKKLDPDLVWFNFPGSAGVFTFTRAIATCQERGIPYWLVDHSVKPHFFYFDDSQVERARNAILGASRYAVNSLRGMKQIEQAIARHLDNSWLFLTARPHAFFTAAEEIFKRSPPQTTGTARLFHLGTLNAAHKGQGTLLEILSDKKWAERDWTLTFQGGGQHKTLIREMLGYYGIPAGRVCFNEFAADILSSFSESDLFVFPSIVEGKGLALVEAMACGRPAVGTPVGGIPELVIDEKTGWLAHSTEPEDIANALERAWNARRRWVEVGSQARAHVEQDYDQDKFFPALVDAMQQDARHSGQSSL